MDSALETRLVPARCPDERKLRALGLRGFAGSVEPTYWCELAIEIQASEVEAYRAASAELYRLYEICVGELLAGPYVASFGLSPKLWALAAHTWRERAQHPHLYGRFDLSGILDGTPAKLIEFNADTATVLAEAAIVQQWQIDRHSAWNDIESALGRGLKSLAASSKQAEPLLLIITLGYPEDDDNALVLQRAAELAGLEAHVAHLPGVTFAAGEGVFRELNPEEWLRYDFIIKIVPWDWIDREEPELLDLLDGLIRDTELIVVNPPYAALMQSKAMLPYLQRRFPDHPNLLAAGLGHPPANVEDYVLKPLWGCEGGDVRVVKGGIQLARSEGDGDTGGDVWQAFTDLPTDRAGYVYQAGVYWAQEPCGLGFRRRYGLIVDGEAQFVSHVLK